MIFCQLVVFAISPYRYWCICIVFAIVSNSTGTSMGFGRCASMPLSIDLRLSLSKASADSAIIGMRASSSLFSLRIAFVACLPFITGIWISIRISAYSSGAAFFIISTAMLPFSAVSTTNPSPSSIAVSISRLISLSSTSRILLLDK